MIKNILENKSCTKNEISHPAIHSTTISEGKTQSVLMPSDRFWLVDTCSSELAITPISYVDFMKQFMF